MKRRGGLSCGSRCVEHLTLRRASMRGVRVGRSCLSGRATANRACYDKESIRQRANSLVLRATQAALSAAKGSGYVVGHPAGRWCREALFFLVWSCPQPVAAANLCELAGIDD